MKGANLSRSPSYWDKYQHGQQWFRFQPIHKDPRSFQKITIQVKEYLGSGWEVHWQYFHLLSNILEGVSISHAYLWSKCSLNIFENIIRPYILKGGSRGSRNPQTILNFPQKDCLRSRKVSRLHCLQSFWLSFPLIMFSHCLTSQWKH